MELGQDPHEIDRPFSQTVHFVHQQDAAIINGWIGIFADRINGRAKRAKLHFLAGKDIPILREELIETDRGKKTLQGNPDEIDSMPIIFGETYTRRVYVGYQDVEVLLMQGESGGVFRVRSSHSITIERFSHISKDELRSIMEGRRVDSRTHKV